MILYIFIPLVLSVTPAQSVCTPISCVTSVHLNVTTASIRDPPYACHGEQLTFTCEVVNAASLQWAFEPDVPCDMPISYTTGDDEGETKGMGSFQSRLISATRNPPNSNFTSDLTITPTASMESVTVVCGNQLSFCSSTESELTLILRDAPVVTQTSLQYYIRSQESCPNISVLIQIDEIQDVATLTYELAVSSSDGCALPECPMLLNPGERVLTITLLNGVNYTATLEVSNDCGTGNTTVSIQPMCEVRVPGPAETQDNRATIGGVVGGIVGGGVVSVAIILVVFAVYLHNKEKDKKHNPLHSAARYGTIEEVISLLKKSDHINEKDDRGRTPLHMAARSGKIEIVKHLVDNNAKTDIKDKKWRTPLHIAAKRGHIETVEHLVDVLQKKGIDIDIKDDYGRTPLHIAAREGRKPGTVKSLVNKGADFNIKDDSGIACLKFKVILNCPNKVITADVIKKMQSGLACVLNLNECHFNNSHLLNEFQQTPLHFAAKEGYNLTIECLVDNGADFNIRDNYGQTPLHYAAREGHEDTVEYLFNKGADINIKDNNGRTPRDIAAEEGHQNIVQLL